MEENKITMKPAKGNNENKNGQPTYEELDNMFKRAYQENQYLRNQLESLSKYVSQLQIDNGFKRLDCLFKSLEYAHYFDDEYIEDVVKEIKEMIIISDNNEGSDNAEEKTEEPANESGDQ